MIRLVFLLALLQPLPTLADSLRVPVGQQGDASIAVPRQGDTQQQVQQHFGEPDKQHPAVGQPPITRWDYPSFSVYFERGRVIDSVRKHQQRTP